VKPAARIGWSPDPTLRKILNGTIVTKQSFHISTHRVSYSIDSLKNYTKIKEYTPGGVVCHLGYPNIVLRFCKSVNEIML